MGEQCFVYKVLSKRMLEYYALCAFFDLSLSLSFGFFLFLFVLRLEDHGNCKYNSSAIYNKNTLTYHYTDLKYLERSKHTVLLCTLFWFWTKQHFIIVIHCSLLLGVLIFFSTYLIILYICCVYFLLFFYLIFNILNQS